MPSNRLIRSHNTKNQIINFYYKSVSFIFHIPSIDKFFLKNYTLIEPPYYCYDKLAKNYLVFIDEFDITKDTILNRIIEEKSKHKIDLISLFSNIYNNIHNSEFSKYFLEESEKRQKLSHKKIGDLYQQL